MSERRDPRPHVVEFYQDANREWRWRRKAGNGETVATGAEGYKNYEDCVGMAAAVNGGSYGTRTLTFEEYDSE